MNKQLGIKLAVVGVAACAAVFALSSVSMEAGSSFFQPMTAVE